MMMNNDEGLSDSKEIKIFVSRKMSSYLNIVDGEPEEVMMDKVAAVEWLDDQRLTEGMGRVIISL